MSPTTSLSGLTLHLDNVRIYNPTALASGAEYKGNVLVAPGATVGKGCLIGPDVSIGDGCIIGDGVRLSNCVVMRGVRVKDHCKVRAWWRHGVEGKDLRVLWQPERSLSAVVVVRCSRAGLLHQLYQ